MTKEEIIKEAQEQVNYCTPMHVKDFVLGYIASTELKEKRIEELENEIIQLKDLLIELYDCIPASMADSCRETLQKVALVFKGD